MKAAAKQDRNTRPTKAALTPSSLFLKSHSRAGSQPAGRQPVIPPARRPKAEAGEKNLNRVQAMETELSLLLSYASDTVYRLRYDTMQYDYISPTVSKLLGFSVEEMKKLNFRSLIAETRLITDGLKKVQSFEELERQRRRGDVSRWQADYLMLTKSGRKIWVSDVSHPWFDDTGRIIGSVGSLRDITERVDVERKLYEELSQRTDVDDLTGMMTKSVLFHELERELKRINRTESEVSLLLVEIDEFHRHREKYGEDVVNQLIKGAAKVIGSQLRITDLPARLGGEGFGVLLVDTSSEGAYIVAERIGDAMLRHRFELGTDKTPFSVTVSIGAASASAASSVDASGLFKQADTQLYIARHSGSSQISADQVGQVH